jgi:DNA-binding XRE family transcriptional regulator
VKPENEIIAHNIKLLREIRNETQAEFGERLGSNQKSIISIPIWCD